MSIKPFGESSCEQELEVLGEQKYKDYFFHEVPFNNAVVQPETYLIIGRRGTGKTSLARYLSFQRSVQDATAIYVRGDDDDGSAYTGVFRRLAADDIAMPRALAMAPLVKIWQSIIWSLIFEHFKDRSPLLEEAVASSSGLRPASSGHLVYLLLQALLERLTRSKKGIEAVVTASDMLQDARFAQAKAFVLAEIAPFRRIFVALDSLEHYAVEDEALMRVTAALIQAAALMNRELSKKGIYVKVAVSAEVFPHLEEGYISNPTKYVQNPVFLHWRPKDLIRLVSWRFYRHLRSTGNLGDAIERNIHWDRFRSVRDLLWNPFFGRELINVRGRPERTFPYVLRHTQLRPRQLVELCNSIARLSKTEGHFPEFRGEVIAKAISQVEAKLAVEVLNAYSATYKNVADIVRTLTGMPNMFAGNELDKVAPRSASYWESKEYSPNRFRQVLAELGVVGRVRDMGPEFVEADFEYALEDRLVLQETDQCVIHPMFYRYLNVKVTAPSVVLPFPDHEEFRGMFDS